MLFISINKYSLLYIYENLLKVLIVLVSRRLVLKSILSTVASCISYWPNSKSTVLGREISKKVILAIKPPEMCYALVPTTLVRFLFSIRIFWAINRPQNHRYWEGRSQKRSFWPVFGPLNPLNEKCAHPHYPGSILIFNTHLLSYRPSSKSPVSYHFVAILAKYGYFWVSPRKFEILYSFFFRSLETWNIKYIAFGIATGRSYWNSKCNPSLPLNHTWIWYHA